MSNLQAVSVDSKIDQVVVYPDRARLTRVGRVAVSTDTTQLVFPDLPLSMLMDSVRVSGAGTARVRIIGVDVRKRFFEETPAIRAKELEAALEALQDENRVLEDRNQMLDGRMTYLDGLREATREYARGIARGQTTVAEQAELLAFLETSDAEVYEGRREVAREQRRLVREIQKIQEELKQIQSSRPRQRYEAVVEIQVLSEGDFSPSLTYVVQRARWQPLYDVRLLEGPAGRQLNLTYLAQISQTTGEDWVGVRMTVSTARPALNQRMPDLSPWFIDAFRPPPQPAPMAAAAMPTRSRKLARPQEATAFADVALEAEAAAESVAAEVVTATVQANDISVSYELPGQIDVPSDGTPRKVTVQSADLGPKIDFVSVPRHTDAVYRRVTVTNTTGAPLLAGSVSLFVDDGFIGSNRIDYTPGGDKIELLFGVEERIKVERELSNRDVDKKFLRDKRQLKYGYDIKLHNLLDREADLVVKDQFPVSRHEEIQVKLSSSRPEPTRHSDMNLLEWEMKLGANSKTTISFEYQVEHPRQLPVSGLQD